MQLHHILGAALLQSAPERGEHLQPELDGAPAHCGVYASKLDHTQQP